MITISDAVPAHSAPVTSAATARLGAESVISHLTNPHTEAIQQEVERLADTLLSSLSKHPSVLLVDVGTDSAPSLWLAKEVASVIGKRLGKTTHLLSLDESRRSKASLEERSPADGNYVLEDVYGALHQRNRVSALVDRLKRLRAAEQPVILHMAQGRSMADLILADRPIDAVVLLVRASQTRRAALLALERQLTEARARVLGCVLLDRIYPIPEKLYRLL